MAKKIVIVIIGFIVFGGIAGGVYFLQPSENDTDGVDDDDEIVVKPGAFTLSSTATDPDTDGNFLLSWAESAGASTYKVYSSTSTITTIDGTLVLVGTTTDTRELLLSSIPTGTLFYVVVAENAAGATLSNELEINILRDAPGAFVISSDAGNPDLDGAYSISWAASSLADNYTVYSYAILITEINGSCAVEELDTVSLSKGISGRPTSTRYYAVTARNIIGTTRSNVLKISTLKDPPGAFGISTTARSPDPDGAFLISWTASSLADNYTLYSYSTPITVINGSCTVEELQTTAQSKSFTNRPTSSLYYAVAANNRKGNTLTSSIQIQVWRHGWSCESGSNSTNQNGIYGPKGEFNANYCPGSRRDSASWTDLEGNLWLFGGYGYAKSGADRPLNDLWLYNITLQQWAWIAGNDNTDIITTYAAPKGIEHVDNNVGSRYAMNYWIDTDGNLWLFGGVGYNDFSLGLLNDCWRFNTTSRLWAWIAGNQSIDVAGVYGQKLVPSPTSYPGARYGATMTYDALANCIWLLGGYGYDENHANSELNDLWKFDLTSNLWVWMAGNKTYNLYATYGQKGVESATNNPGRRQASSLWYDPAGYLWLFGGYGVDETTNGRLNDLWRYNLASNQWTWVGGNKTVNLCGIYGTQNQPSPSNCPGAREKMKYWSDALGNLWLYGGYGYPASGSSGDLSDLWCYNIMLNQWVYVAGSQLIEEPRTLVTGLHVVDASNAPGARVRIVSWVDLTGNLWIFGGLDNSEYRNDLWIYYLL